MEFAFASVTALKFFILHLSSLDLCRVLYLVNLEEIVLMMNPLDCVGGFLLHSMIESPVDDCMCIIEGWGIDCIN